MCVTDRALFYHSNAGVDTGVVGEMTIASAAYPDPTQFDPSDPHYDATSDPSEPRWLCVDVSFVRRLPAVVRLTTIKADPAFAEHPLVRRGNRLSVLPLSASQYAKLVALGVGGEARS